MMSEYKTFINIILRGQEGRRGVEQAPLEGDRQETVFDVPPEHIIQSSSGRGWDGLDVAAVMHLSPYHFACLFKESVGFLPHQYVIQRRVERAKLLLSTTNWSLTTIAHTVGFAHESHLALHFKRLTGVTPRYYR